jgi:hypothetical protein
MTRTASNKITWHDTAGQAPWSQNKTMPDVVAPPLAEIRMLGVPPPHVLHQFISPYGDIVGFDNVVADGYTRGGGG